MDEKSYGNIFFITIHSKLIGTKPLRVYDGARYLVLFGPGTYDAIYSRNKHLVSQICDIIKMDWFYKMDHLKIIKCCFLQFFVSKNHWLCIML